MKKTFFLLALCLAIGIADKEAYALCINPNFEDGLSYWTVGGDAATASAITSFEGVIFPPEGSQMAMISTAGNTVFETTLSQSFNPLPMDLTFRVNFLTSENNLLQDPFFDSNDTFTAHAFAGGIIVASLTLDTLSPLISPSPVAGFPFGTGFVPFIAPAGTDQLVFSITDIGDATHPSVALIDDDQSCSASCDSGSCTASCKPGEFADCFCTSNGSASCNCKTSVPGPSTLILLAGGLVSMLFLPIRRRHQRFKLS